jgi:D-alanyl-D-alanine carboxypeptidase
LDRQGLVDPGKRVEDNAAQFGDNRYQRRRHLAVGKLLRTALFLICCAAAPAVGAEYAAVVVDAASGTVIHETAATARWYPASLTKVMTVYLAFEEIEAGRLKLDEALPISKHAAAQSPTELGLGAGETITTEEAIHAVILQSANDAAVVLAERIGGSEEKFAERMTAKAKALGMTRTAFRNATGLPDPQQVTTARDMAVLAMALLQTFPQHYHFFSAKSFTYQGHSFGTINGILSRYEGADGIKTGFTCGSGYNLIASAMRQNRRIVGVLLGGLSSEERHGQMAQLLDDGFAADLAKLEKRILLADLSDPENGDDPAPPMQLSAAECAYGVGASSTEAGIIAGGWAVVFGASASRAEAQRLLTNARMKLRPAFGAGRPAIVPKKWEGLRRYTAMLTGLSKEQAGKACKHLWSIGLYCLALSPQVLNNRRSAWR